MAEAPLSPVAQRGLASERTGSVAVLNNENSSSATTAASTVTSVVASYTHGAGGVSVDVQCPVAAQLQLKLPILSSSSDTDGEEQQLLLMGGSEPASGGRSASPPPNCAICLGRCKNKCFTDSCMHQFCFKCLCEWSKVKPECPLCKQTFKSIIHNVKSIHQFEEYHVQPPTVQIPHRPMELGYAQMPIVGFLQHGHNFNEISVRNWDDTHRITRAGRTILYSSSFTGGSMAPAAAGNSVNEAAGIVAGNVRNQFIYRGELLDMYRQEYPDAIASSGTLSQLWRRYVYDRKLFALPVCDITGRFRESSARFYRDNPSQIHRLMPWINRDIVCLLRQTEHDVSTVLESINEALSLMNILSPAFRRRLQPYLGSKTSHFIHELNNFARSPYDMIGYDRAVQYSPQSGEEIVIEFSSSGSSDEESINVTDGDGGTTATAATAAAAAATSAARTRSDAAPAVRRNETINLTTHNRANSSSNMVIDLEESETQSLSIGATGDHRRPTNADTSAEYVHSAEAVPVVTDNIELTSGSSDECEFVLERKPPHLRTPELVSLDSATDSDVVFVEESKPLRKATFNTSGEEEAADGGAPLSTSRKLSALAEAKKRSQTSNSVKYEQELYNVGASTSAGLRSSGCRRRQKSLDAEKRTLRRQQRTRRRCLRSSGDRPKAYESSSASKRSSKRTGSQTSHSTTTSISSSSTSSTTTSSSSSESSSNTSDYEYAASARYRKQVRRKRRTGGDVYAERAQSSRAHSSKRKVVKRKSLRTSRAESPSRGGGGGGGGHVSSSDEEHADKKYALLKTIREEMKKQQEQDRKRLRRRRSAAHRSSSSDVEDAEDAWRNKAINESLRKQQQQQVQAGKRRTERRCSNGGRVSSEGVASKRRRTSSSVGNARVSSSSDSDEEDNLSLNVWKTQWIRQRSVATTSAAEGDAPARPSMEPMPTQIKYEPFCLQPNGQDDETQAQSPCHQEGVVEQERNSPSSSTAAATEHNYCADLDGGVQNAGAGAVGGRQEAEGGEEEGEVEAANSELRTTSALSFAWSTATTNSDSDVFIRHDYNDNSCNSHNDNNVEDEAARIEQMFDASDDADILSHEAVGAMVADNISTSAVDFHLPQDYVDAGNANNSCSSRASSRSRSSCYSSRSSYSDSGSANVSGSMSGLGCNEMLDEEV